MRKSFYFILSFTFLFYFGCDTASFRDFTDVNPFGPIGNGTEIPHTEVWLSNPFSASECIPFWHSMVDKNDYNEGYEAGKETVMCQKELYCAHCQRNPYYPGADVWIWVPSGIPGFEPKRVYDRGNALRAFRNAAEYQSNVAYYKTIFYLGDWYKGFHDGYVTYTLIDDTPYPDDPNLPR